jgi:maltose alpha-D-glucosyltransferase/alpha-amylase
MAFHFPLMPRMFMAVEMEDRYPIIDILEQTPELPRGCQWAMFLRNHDELTLEMVTDEERDYMYRIYAVDPRARINLGIRRRLAPLLDNDRRKVELMNVLLMSMPGSPVIYYGDEIGMGDNYYLGDRDGVRTPMQWSANKNAGFSEANPQKLYLPAVIDPEYHFETINVENQEQRNSSLLWWMRRLIAMRRSRKVFGRGGIEFLTPENSKVLAFVRRYEGEAVLVAVNLSRHSQVCDLALSDFLGIEPRDMFSWNAFRRVSAEDYTLSFAPYGYYVLDMGSEAEREEAYSGLPLLKARSWRAIFDNKDTRNKLETKVLPGYIARQRWFGGKARPLRSMKLLERVPVGRAADEPLMLLVNVEYTEGSSEIYILPVTYMHATGEEDLPRGAMARAEIGGNQVVIYEAVYSKLFCEHILDLIAGHKRLAASQGKLTATSGKELKKALRNREKFECRLLGAEQSNTSILYGQELIMKFYRRTEKGVHPDLEMVRFLTEKAGYSYTPPYAGSMEYVASDGSRMVLGLMQGFVANQGDAFEQSLDLVTRFYERVLALNHEGSATPPKAPPSIMDVVEQDELPEPLNSLVAGMTHEMARLLGKRTAEMHKALASDRRSAGMRPENFSTLYQRSLYQAMQNQAKQELRMLSRSLKKLPEHIRGEAEEVLGLRNRILEKLRGITGAKLRAQKIRIHGDFHLGQVLYTGKDYFIFDFEGEPARPLSERRLKRSPVRDVAGIVRSYQYAAYSVLMRESHLREEDRKALEPWAELWYVHVCGAFIRSYLDNLGDSPMVPRDREQFERMLHVYLIQKAVYEMGYELNNRPEWLVIPLRGIKYLCGE